MKNTSEEDYRYLEYNKDVILDTDEQWNGFKWIPTTVREMTLAPTTAQGNTCCYRRKISSP